MPNSNSNILIYQQMLMHYRVPVFNQLAEKLRQPLIIATGTTIESLDLDEIRFEIKTCPSFNVGPFRKNQGLGKFLKNSTANILPFDVHELSTLKSVVKRSYPLVIWGHSHGRRSYLKGVRRWMIRRSDAVIVYTQFGKDKLVNEGIDAQKIFVANNTVDIRNAGFDDSIERTSFLFSGRITARKKVDEALVAFAKIKNEIPKSISFEIIGDGPERGKLEQLARDCEISDRVCFHGSIYEADLLKEIFQRSLAFVSPGHVGLGVLHSFAYGIPPLTRRVARHAPEFHHIVENENGLLFDGTIDDLAQAMKSIANDAANLEVGKNGYFYYCQNCTLDKATDGIVAALKHAISRFRRQ